MNKKLAILFICIFVPEMTSAEPKNFVTKFCYSALLSIGDRAGFMFGRDRFDILPSNTYPIFQDEPEIYRRGFISDQHVQEARNLIGSISGREEKLERLFEFYLEIRFRQYPPRIQRRIRNMIVKMDIRIGGDNPGVSGYHMAPKNKWIDGSNRMGMFVNPLMMNSASYFATKVHEVEHAIQQLDKNYDLGASVTKEWEKYYSEFGAIRAEYEFWQLVPQELRDEDMKLASQLPDVDFGRASAVANIQSAPKGFTEFRRTHLYSSYEATKAYYWPEPQMTGK
jgi:hypothetical protein